MNNETIKRELLEAARGAVADYARSTRGCHALGSNARVTLTPSDLILVEGTARFYLTVLELGS